MKAGGPGSRPLPAQLQQKQQKSLLLAPTLAALAAALSPLRSGLRRCSAAAPLRALFLTLLTRTALRLLLRGLYTGATVLLAATLLLGRLLAAFLLLALLGGLLPFLLATLLLIGPASFLLAALLLIRAASFLLAALLLIGPASFLLAALLLIRPASFLLAALLLIRAAPFLLAAFLLAAFALLRRLLAVLLVAPTFSASALLVGVAPLGLARLLSIASFPAILISPPGGPGRVVAKTTLLAGRKRLRLGNATPRRLDDVACLSYRHLAAELAIAGFARTDLDRARNSRSSCQDARTHVIKCGPGARRPRQ